MARPPAQANEPQRRPVSPEVHVQRRRHPHQQDRGRRESCLHSERHPDRQRGVGQLPVDLPL